MKSQQEVQQHLKMASLNKDIYKFDNLNKLIIDQSNNDSNNQQISNNNNNCDSYNYKQEFPCVNKDSLQMQEFQIIGDLEQNSKKNYHENREYQNNPPQKGYQNLQHQRVNNNHVNQDQSDCISLEKSVKSLERNSTNDQKQNSQIIGSPEVSNKDINLIQNAKFSAERNANCTKQHEQQRLELYIDEETSNFDNQQRDTNNKNISQHLKDHSLNQRGLQENDNQTQILQEQEDYFNLTDNKKLDEICQKVNFERNSLNQNFGKLKREGLIIESDSLLGVEKEFELTEKQKKARDQLIHSLRRRSQIFLVLNIIWIIIIGLTYIEAQDWFKLKTFDTLSLDLLVTANGFTIMEMVLWIISIIIGLNGIVNFSIMCLRIYQIGILITIIFEFLVNIILLNFVPLSLAKSFIIMLFHGFFICAGKIVQNAMLAFRQRYVPILYHCQLSIYAELQQQQQNQNRTPNQVIQQESRIYQLQNIHQQNQENNRFNHQQQNNEFLQSIQQQQQVLQPNYFPQNIQQLSLLNQSESNQKQQLIKLQDHQQPQQIQQYNKLNYQRNISNHIEQDSSEQIFYQQLQVQTNDKKVNSVIEFENKAATTNLNKKSDIASFPTYDKSQSNSDNPQKQNLIGAFSNKKIMYNQNIKLNMQEYQKKSSTDALQIQRKETTLSSNAQGSQTTLPSNNFNHFINTPSQISPNLEDIEIHIATQ